MGYLGTALILTIPDFVLSNYKSHKRGYQFEVVLNSHSIKGCILSDQIKNLDYVQRKCSFIEKASEDEINSVVDNITLMLK